MPVANMDRSTSARTTLVGGFCTEEGSTAPEKFVIVRPMSIHSSLTLTVLRGCRLGMTLCENRDFEFLT